MKQFAPYIVIALLGTLIVDFGILPAFKTIDTDFPNYYTSSRLLLEKKEISRLYDDDWFQSQIYSYGIHQSGKFSPFPPITAFIMIPFAWLPPSQALEAWTVMNIGLCIACVVLLRAAAGGSIPWNMFLLCGSGLALINNFRFGQFYLVVCVLLIGAYVAHARGYLISSGILLGIGASFKYFPIIFLLLYAVRREWRLVIACLASVAVIYAIGIIVLGYRLHQEFISNILTNHLIGNIQNPFSTTFQSWDSFLRRMFVYDATFNQAPLFSSVTAFILGKISVFMLVAVPTLGMLRKASNTLSVDAYQKHYACLSLGAFLLLPATATYHVLMLILPIGLLFASPWNSWNKYQYLILAIYLTIGFLPYRLFRPFEDSPSLFCLAYPRLFLMSLLFLLAVSHAYWTSSQQARIPSTALHLT